MTSKLQKNPLALKREHPALQNMKFLNFFLLLWVIFALLDPEPDSESGSGYGSETLVWDIDCIKGARYCSGKVLVPYIGYRTVICSYSYRAAPFQNIYDSHSLSTDPNTAFANDKFIETQEWSWICLYSTALSTGLTHMYLEDFLLIFALADFYS